MGKIDYAKWNNVGDSEDEEEKENNEYRSGVYRSLHRETQLLFDYASAGQPQLVEEVLNKGAFIDGRLPQNGNTALHMSLWLQHADVSRLLIARGANLELKDNDGFRPLHTAAWAAFEGDVAMTKLLLESGALMDQPSNSGCTPLHLAAAANKDIVQILLEGGSNPLVKNSDGKTPREYSIAKGFGATMKRKQWEELLAMLLAAEKRWTKKLGLPEPDSEAAPAEITGVNKLANEPGQATSSSPAQPGQATSSSPAQPDEATSSSPGEHT